jgi:hypothetical protein
MSELKSCMPTGCLTDPRVLPPICSMALRKSASSAWPKAYSAVMKNQVSSFFLLSAFTRP